MEIEPRRKMLAVAVAVVSICAMVGVGVWMISGLFERPSITVENLAATPGAKPAAAAVAAPKSAEQMKHDAAVKIGLAVMAAPKGMMPTQPPAATGVVSPQVVPPVVVPQPAPVAVVTPPPLTEEQKHAIELAVMKKDAAVRIQIAVIPKPRR